MLCYIDFNVNKITQNPLQYCSIEICQILPHVTDVLISQLITISCDFAKKKMVYSAYMYTRAYIYIYTYIK